MGVIRSSGDYTSSANSRLLKAYTIGWLGGDSDGKDGL